MRLCQAPMAPFVALAYGLAVLPFLAGCTGSAVQLSQMDAIQIQSARDVDLCNAHLGITIRHIWDLPIGHVDEEIARRGLDCSPIYAQYGIYVQRAPSAPVITNSDSPSCAGLAVTNFGRGQYYA